MLKKYSVLLLLVMCLALSAAKSSRITKISGKVANVTGLEIVVPNSIPIVKKAASELQEMLSAASGTKVPVVKTPSAGAFSLILGDNE